MSNVFGKNLTVSLFGESHGPAIGAVLDGIPGGVKIDKKKISYGMLKRKASGSISTGREEADEVTFLSGVKDGYSQGTPIALTIQNTNFRRQDYNHLIDTARPGHADYTGYVKYNGFADLSGGGHFSGRLTAPLVACGMIAMTMLEEKGIYLGTHIQELHGIKDDPFDIDRLQSQINTLNMKIFAVLNEDTGTKMKDCIEEARMNLDSVGGILETCIVNMPVGIGDPEFDSLESKLAHAMFSIPAVKGIEFGLGFAFKDAYGSTANDPLRIKDDKIVTLTNNNGGINGGISNGMPIVFRTVVKPTSSVSKKQQTVNYVTRTEKDLEIHGRHDPAIIHRARIVQDAMCALTIVDCMMERFGQNYFGGKK